MITKKTRIGTSTKTGLSVWKLQQKKKSEEKKRFQSYRNGGMMLAKRLEEFHDQIGLLIIQHRRAVSRISFRSLRSVKK
jgi:hypothetical protein